MNETPHIDNIFSAEEEDCLDLKQMQAYHRGQLRGVDKYYAERHLLNCELCNMAFEGVAEESAEVVEAGMADITDRAWDLVAARKKKRRRGAFMWVSMAASIVLLVTVGYFFMQRPAGNSDPALADKGPNKEIEEKTAPQRALEGATDSASADAPPTNTGIDGNKDFAMNDVRAKNDLEKSVLAEPGLRDAVNESDAKDEISSPLDNRNSGGGDLLAGATIPDVKVKEDDWDMADNEMADADIAAEEEIVAPAEVPEDKRLATGSVGKENASDFDAGPESKLERAKEVPSTALGGVIRENADIAEVDQLKNARPAKDNAPAIDAYKKSVESLTQAQNMPSAKSGKTIFGSKKGKTKAAAPSRADAFTTNDNFKSTRDRKADVDGGGTTVGEVKDPYTGRAEIAETREGEDEEEQAVVETDADDIEDGNLAEKASNYALGMQSFAMADYQKSSSLLRKAAADTPANYNAHLFAAISFNRIEQPQAAIYHLDLILKAPGTTLKSDAEYHKARALVQLGEKEKARALLEKIIMDGGAFKIAAQSLLDKL